MALKHIAVGRAEAGDFAGALEITKQLSARQAFPILQAVAKIKAKADAEAGDFSGALQLAELLEEADDRAEALVSIAVAQFEAGNVTGAQETVAEILDVTRKIDPVSERDWNLGNFVKVLAGAGNFSGGLQIAQEIKDWTDRAKAFIAISRMQFAAGDILHSQKALTEAEQIAVRIFGIRDRAEVLSAIAAAKFESDDELGFRKSSAIATDALKAVQQINEVAARDQTLRIASTYYSEVGHFSAAMSIAQLIKIAKLRAYALSEIASDQVQAGDVSGALETFVSAIEIAQLLDDPLSRSDILRVVLSETSSLN